MPLVLVTGSTEGIGKETARQLLARGAQVIVHGRSEERAIAAARELGADAAWWADFSSLREVRERAAALPAGIDVLINNAGIYTKAKTRSAEGHEITYAVNHLAPFLLTQLLLERQALHRIVNVASQVHLGASLDDLDHLSGYEAYGASKLANVLFTFELAARRNDLTANCLHPGVVGTKLLRQGFGGMSGPDTVSEGAATSVFLALSEDVAGITGKYFIRSREARPSPLAHDKEARRHLWESSEQMVRSAA